MFPSQFTQGIETLGEQIYHIVERHNVDQAGVDVGFLDSVRIGALLHSLVSPHVT